MEADSEVFEHAPLAMVVAEIQFSFAPALVSDEAMAAVLGGVKGYTPVMERQEEVFDVPSGDGSTTRHTKTSMEAKSLDGQITTELNPEALIVAMSGVAYKMYADSLRPLVELAYSGLLDVVPDLLVTRVGLRYLDEIRVPEPSLKIGSWLSWISPALLGPCNLLESESGAAVGLRSSWKYTLPGDRIVQLTYGPFKGAGVVGPEHPFYNSDRDEELMFIVDIDASWTPSSGAHVDLCDLIAHYDELHLPTQKVFAAAITAEARDLFRKGRS